MISREEVKKLSSLARIAMTDEEADQFAGEVSPILDYVGQVSEVAGEGDMESPPTLNTMRGDSDPHESGIFTEKILAEAPDKSEKNPLIWK